MPSSTPTSRSFPTSLLVLGGTSDIATATVRELARRGLRTAVLAGRSLDRLAASRDALSDCELEAVHLAEFDASDTASHDGSLQATAADHGPFDAVLIAFGDLGSPFTIDESGEDAARLIATNFNGAVSAALAAAWMLSDSGGGTLAVISSIAAVRPRVGNLVYGSAKAGLDAFAGGLRDALDKTDVEVMVIRPGFVHTAMTEGLEPAPFATTPEAVAKDIADGFEQRSALVWSPKVLRFVAPMLKSMPAKLWRRMSAS